jgi:pilus assembly protein CpaF
MSLLERVEAAKHGTDGETGIMIAGPQPPAPAEVALPSPVVSPREQAFRDIRRRIEAEVADALASRLDLSDPGGVRKELAGAVDGFVTDFIETHGLNVTRDERQRLIDAVINDAAGFGPIEPYLADDTITEVMVNGPDKVYVERAGKIVKVDATFRDDEHVLNVIDRIITPLGRHVDETSPRVDARLPDGSRVNAIIRPLSLVGPVITIRKFATRFSVEDLVGFGTATPEMFDFLRACVEAKLNVFLSGGTGSGKTTTLNVLSSFIPDKERIITIEDAAELQLTQEHVVTLEARPANLEGQGEITIRDLLRNALHMRPDRIVVGECRAGEALDMIQAMTTGQEGSLSTGHANTPADMLRRLETMILMTGYELPMRAIREQITSAIDVIVHTARLRDGSRKIVSITEVYGIEDDDILTQEIFRFEQTAYRDGKVEGALVPTGVRPRFMGIFRSRGVALPPGEYGIPPEDPSKPAPAGGKSRWNLGASGGAGHALPLDLGLGSALTAGGMAWISGVGPVDADTGELHSNDVRGQTRRCMQNLKMRLEEQGSSLDRVVWANWSLREPSEFDTFYEEWQRWFEGAPPMGQTTLLPLVHRRAGFRVTLGAIAPTGILQDSDAMDGAALITALRANASAHRAVGASTGAT